MSLSTPGIFVRSVFAGAVRQTSQKAAAAGFAQIFTTMVAKQMRQSMVGADHGPMGIGGGAAGDIYGAFIDQAMGKALVNSKSMNPLTKMIDRELSGPRHPINPTAKDSSLNTVAMVGQRPMASASVSKAIETGGKVLPNYTGVTMPSDLRGPILLPPTPSITAPVLLPPPSEG